MLGICDSKVIVVAKKTQKKDIKRVFWKMSEA